jgi:hypothetical protein
VASLRRLASPIRHGIHVVSARAQVDHQRTTKLGLVLDDEHPGHGATGKVIVMVSRPRVLPKA